MFKLTFKGKENERACLYGRQLRPGESIEVKEVPTELHGNKRFQVEKIEPAAPVKKPVPRVGDRIEQAGPQPEEKPAEKESAEKPAPEKEAKSQPAAEEKPVEKEPEAEKVPEEKPAPKPKKSRKKK